MKQMMLEYNKFKDQINDTKIEVELLGEAMEMLARLPDDKRDSFEERARSVYNFLAKKGYEDCGLASMAIMLRLMALDTVIDDPEVKGLVISNPVPKVIYLHYDLLRTAVEEPIVEGNQGEPMFVTENFKVRLLQLSGAGGSA